MSAAPRGRNRRAARAADRPTGARTDATSARRRRPRAASGPMLRCAAMMRSPFTADDRARLADRGIDEPEALRQLAQLREPPPRTVLVRPCTAGDGIVRWDDAERARLAAVHEAAAARGELAAFVPASGAATRMFRDLLAGLATGSGLERDRVTGLADAGDAAMRTLLEFPDGLPRFAFHDALADAVAARGGSLVALAPDGPWRPVLEALLGEPGLGYAQRPKGLILFHRDADGARTAFAEHLAEAAALYRDATGRVRLHATASPEHLDGFRAELERARSGGATYDVTFSVQDPATDTLAIGADGEPARDGHGALVLRPAGHGALLANLERAPAPVVMLRNIDNIAAAPWRAPVLERTRAVVGAAVALRGAATELACRLDAGDADAADDARAFLATHGFAGGDAADAAALRAAVDRPLRVCGMVPNTGEPGGGPFWVRGTDGRVTRQVVETAQVDAADAAQRAILAASTHFNPVFMACALDDAHGRRHALARFVDADAVIVTRRSAGGRDVVALERPGLWNGGMAGWNTVFVEVPLAVFNPVKTVNDLLRREHQPADGT